MIDSGASGTFISAQFVKHHGIATRKKKDGGYEVTAVDGSSLPDVDSETMPLQLTFQKHHEEVVLDVIPMARHDVVLGTPLGWNGTIHTSSGKGEYSRLRDVAALSTSTLYINSV